MQMQMRMADGELMQYAIYQSRVPNKSSLSHRRPSGESMSQGPVFKCK